MNFPAELKYSKSHEWVKLLDDTTALVGISKPVIKAHGSSKAKGIKNAIRQAKICVENDLCGTMQSALDELAAAQKTEE